MLKADAPQSVRLYRLCMFDGRLFAFRVAGLSHNYDAFTTEAVAKVHERAANLPEKKHDCAVVHGIIAHPMAYASRHVCQ